MREPSPPTTPLRQNGSVESSPIDHAGPPSFEEVTWDPNKRRCTDTLPGPHDPRRSSVIDPALAGSVYSSPRASQPASLSGVALPTVTGHHHRPSLPYPPPLPAPSGGHSRHQSSPGPQTQNMYPPQLAHSSRHPAPSYPPPSAQQYDHRTAYFQEGPPHVRHDSCYGRYSTAPHAGYSHDVAYEPGTLYHNYTFQSALGPDSSTFNRKRRGNLPKEATGILKSWFNSHRDSPYPTEDEKVALCNQTGLTLNQVCQISLFCQPRKLLF